MRELVNRIGSAAGNIGGLEDGWTARGRQRDAGTFWERKCGVDSERGLVRRDDLVLGQDCWIG